jgi:rhodanese-related sulfurtransferase
MDDNLRIEPEAAKRMVDAGDAIVLDVVASGAWASLDVAVPGAVRIAPEEIATRWQELPQQKAIVAYCT